VVEVHTSNYLEETGIAWSANKVAAYRDVLLEFLNCWTIASKERGNMVLGGNLNGAQSRVVEAIFDGLQRGIHDFKFGKGRQQGISTICRPFSTLWIALHPGARGAFVLDTSTHMQEAREEIEHAVSLIPKRLRFPAWTSNRYGGRFSNGSNVTFLSAGTRTTTASSALGRGRGVNVVHASEIGTWGAPEAVVSFEKSLAKEWENRLYLWESTGRNVGSIWWKVWQDALANDLEEMATFTGWWGIETNRIPRASPLFERYGRLAPTAKEKMRMAEVEERYGHEISPEQLAWIRKETNPRAFVDGAEIDEEGFDAEDDYQVREDPWTEEEMFTTDGSNFFAGEALTKVAKAQCSDDFASWTYYPNGAFLDMRIDRAPSRRDIHLKVWQEPKPDATYIVAADPAYGANERNDRSAAQVLRCYADRIEQVAEFASNRFKTHEFAWVLASLMGWYKNTRLMLEINGPGNAVWLEYSSLKRIMNTYLRKEAEEKGLKDFFVNAKTYLYSRPDALIPGIGSVHHKTTGANKVFMMERVRDFVANAGLIIRSREVIEEMRVITRNGDSIEAEGSDHDDRVLALAMGILCWEQQERPRLIGLGQTYELEQARGRMSLSDQYEMMTKHHLNRYFQGRAADRAAEVRVAQRMAWRGR